MTLTALPNVAWPNVIPFPLVNDFADTGMLIDAADEAAAFIVQVPVTGTLTGFIAKLGTVTTGATIQCRLETVSTADGKPTGTLYNANATGSLVVLATDDNKVVSFSFGSSFTVTAGDIVAFIVKQPNTSFGNMYVVGWGYAG